MSEWLDLMLDEISRKKREAREAMEETKRRADANKKKQAAPDNTQSK